LTAPSEVELGDFSRPNSVRRTLSHVIPDTSVEVSPLFLKSSPPHLPFQRIFSRNFFLRKESPRFGSYSQKFQRGLWRNTCGIRGFQNLSAKPLSRDSLQRSAPAAFIPATLRAASFRGQDPITGRMRANAIRDSLCNSGRDDLGRRFVLNLRGLLALDPPATG